jgi:hypothetical protein
MSFVQEKENLREENDTIIFEHSSKCTDCVWTLLCPCLFVGRFFVCVLYYFQQIFRGILHRCSKLKHKPVTTYRDHKAEAVSKTGLIYWRVHFVKNNGDYSYSDRMMSKAERALIVCQTCREPMEQRRHPDETTWVLKNVEIKTGKYIMYDVQCFCPVCAGQLKLKLEMES